MIRRVLLIGAGAIGMLHAVKLAKCPGVSLQLVADAARRQRYKECGLYFNDEAFDFVFADAPFPAELIIIATKFPHYREALDAIAPFVHKETILLPVLNGISSAAIAREAFPQAKVVSGFFLGHASVRTGMRVYHDGVGKTSIGAVDDPDSAGEVSKVKALFDAAGIPVDVPCDMRAALWKKFILNIGVNQTSAFFRADYGTIQQNRKMLDFAEKLMGEAFAVAQREKVAVSADAVAEAMQVIRTMPPDAKTSMLQDVESDRPTEIDLFSGELLRRAAKYGMTLPANAEVWQKLGVDAK